MDTQTRPELIDDLLIDDLVEMYIQWREECLTVRRAYEHWSNVPRAERELAFTAFRAALDREQQASAVYANRLSRIPHQPPGARELTAVG